MKLQIRPKNSIAFTSSINLSGVPMFSVVVLCSYRVLSCLPCAEYVWCALHWVWYHTQISLHYSISSHSLNFNCFLITLFSFSLQNANQKDVQYMVYNRNNSINLFLSPSLTKHINYIKFCLILQII